VQVIHPVVWWLNAGDTWNLCTIARYRLCLYGTSEEVPLRDTDGAG